MIKFTYGKGKKVSLGLGIARENVNRLIAGKPILVRLSEVGTPIDDEILLYFGETEQDLMDQVREFLTPETKMSIDPRLNIKGYDNDH